LDYRAQLYSHLKVRTLLFRILFFIIPVLIFPQNRTQIDSVNQTSDITVFSNIEENIRVFKQNVKDAQSIGYSAGKAQALLHLGLAQLFVWTICPKC